MWMCMCIITVLLPVLQSVWYCSSLHKLVHIRQRIVCVSSILLYHYYYYYYDIYFFFCFIVWWLDWITIACVLGFDWFDECQCGWFVCNDSMFTVRALLCHCDPLHIYYKPLRNVGQFPMFFHSINGWTFHFSRQFEFIDDSCHSQLSFC